METNRADLGDLNRYANQMQLHIESDDDLLAGRTPHPITKKVSLPVQRFVVASCSFEWGNELLFTELAFVNLLPILNLFMSKVGCNEFDPEYPWMEVEVGSAREAAFEHLNTSQAYSLEIRSESDARSLASQLVYNRTDTRYFVPEGDPITEHTFDFGVLIVRPVELAFFWTWDED